MSRFHTGRLAVFSLSAAALLLAATCWSLRPALHAADPAPAAQKSPEDMKPAEDAKPAAFLLPSPQNWPPGQVIFEQGDAEKKIRALLTQPDDFDIGDALLSDLTEMMQKRHQINVQLDTEALAADGKGVETPFSKKLGRLPMYKGLRLILDPLGLTYLVKNDVLLITTKAAASQPENLTTRIYQVHDLVVAPNDLNAIQPDFDALIELITSTIRQSDWQDNGGTIGFIRPYVGPGMLVLVATHEEQGHEEIEQLLTNLRAARLPGIRDAQARQPLKPRQEMNGPIYGYAGGMGGGGAALHAAMLQAMTEALKNNAGNIAPPNAACAAGTCPTPKPTGTAPAGNQPATPAQQTGGGYF